jgi:hypothetical protein
MPGKTAVVALDGVDHSIIHPSLPDLSDADFELEGMVDADNPDEPNMPEVGPFRNPYCWLHGVLIECDRGCFLAQATDLGSLVRRRPTFSSHEWVVIPMESILDVVTTDIWNPSYDTWHPCATKVQRNLDRLEKPLRDVYYDVSLTMQRSVLRTGPGGFPLLQAVGVSFADFTVAPRSPGWIGN